ncbi:hypothetical protein SBY92_002711 [Candida maltosa Xu316]|uniref:Uncharacterized protein n=1 Tax=Candida maltosa (strain Xu316) TaxID=1245528 RepID=M3HGY0_CANMX|nr:hypothetical protein G210_3220 [Candida maltosa Xu316]
MSINIDHIIKSSKEFYPEINKELSDQITKKYDGGTKTFDQLNAWKDVELPETLLERYEETDSTWITKKELINLIDLKLAKGTFRPMMPKLIKSNEDEVIEDTTKSGFQVMLDFFKTHKKESMDEFWADATDQDKNEYIDAIEKSMEILCELKGVGPASATLLLSLLVKISPYLTPPYFSDESYAFYVVTPYKDDDYKVKYTTKEYVNELLPVYFEIVAQHPKETMDSLEKGAWAMKNYLVKKDGKLANIDPIFEEDEMDKLSFDEQPVFEGRTAPPPKRKKQKKSK